MSLLLEALKKAERAKEEAQRRAKEGGGEATDAPAASAEAERKPVLTRDQLPDLATTPLEIASDDLAAPPAPKPPRPEPTLEPLEPAPKPAPRAAGPKPGAAKLAAAEGETQSAGRASARKVFEAKFREPNPKIPFYITLGVLGAFAVGTVIYFWYQLRPPPSLVNLNPPRQAETSVADAGATPRPTVAAAPAPAQSVIPGLPGTGTLTSPATTTAASPPAPAVTTPAARVAPIERPVEAPRPRQRVAEVQPAPMAVRESPRVARSAPEVNPRVEAGYVAYTAGNLAAARSEYEQALRDEPMNRDALLGLAAIDVRGGRYESAEALYLRVLQVEPRDPQAQAALVSLRSGRNDPLATESRVKSLLAADPSAHALNFALGNQFAQQNRWAEAQQEYFKAYTADPDNADFAYNVAVSLDHLRQPRQALDYYQRAISLSQKRGASFDLGAAKARAAELSH
jgi:tetratricopeptide (TPR) repeat protein